MGSCRSNQAVAEILDLASATHAIEMEPSSPLLHRIGKDHFDARPVDEAVLNHLSHGSRLGQKVEHGLMATRDHGFERVEHLEEGLALLD